MAVYILHAALQVPTNSCHRFCCGSVERPFRTRSLLVPKIPPASANLTSGWWGMKIQMLHGHMDGDGWRWMEMDGDGCADIWIHTHHKYTHVYVCIYYIQYIYIYNILITWNRGTSPERIPPMRGGRKITYTNHPGQKEGLHNIYQYIPIYTNVYQYIPIYTNVYQCIPMYTNIYQYIPIYTNIYQYSINIS